MDERFVDRLAEFRQHRSKQEALQINELRRLAFQITHAWACDGSAELCDERFTWCRQMAVNLAHSTNCTMECQPQCMLIKQLIRHLWTCTVRNCCVCRFRHHNIDDIRSEVEDDAANGENVVRIEQDQDLDDSIDDPEAAEDED